MLGHIIVMSSAYDRAPTYTPFIIQPKPDLRKRSNKGSIYKLKKNGEITPPCLTPLP